MECRRFSSCFCGTSCRFIFMMVLETAFFFAKIMMGYTYHDVLLIVDSFHIILDIMSLTVGFVAFKVSAKYSIGYIKYSITSRPIVCYPLGHSALLLKNKSFTFHDRGEPSGLVILTYPRLLCFLAPLALSANLFWILHI